MDEDDRPASGVSLILEKRFPDSWARRAPRALGLEPLRTGLVTSRQNLESEARSGLDEFVAHRVAHECRRRGEAELAHGGRAVRLDRLHADMQKLRDTPV